MQTTEFLLPDSIRGVAQPPAVHYSGDDMIDMLTSSNYRQQQNRGKVYNEIPKGAIIALPVSVQRPSATHTTSAHPKT